ncbi:MAG: T9SS type A sorting domain-containing protein [Flavobacteriales bacterium]
MKKIVLLSIVLCGLSFSAFSSESISSVENKEILSSSPSSELQTISFVLKKPSMVTLEIFDLQGKLIKIVKRNESMDSGKHTIHIDTASLKKGSYFRKLSIDGKLTKVEVIENK